MTVTLINGGVITSPRLRGDYGDPSPAPGSYGGNNSSAPQDPLPPAVGEGGGNATANSTETPQEPPAPEGNGTLPSDTNSTGSGNNSAEASPSPALDSSPEALPALNGSAEASPSPALDSSPELSPALNGSTEASPPPAGFDSANTTGGFNGSTNSTLGPNETAAFPGGNGTAADCSVALYARANMSVVIVDGASAGTTIAVRVEGAPNIAADSVVAPAGCSFRAVEFDGEVANALSYDCSVAPSFASQSLAFLTRDDAGECLASSTASITRARDVSWARLMLC